MKQVVVGLYDDFEVDEVHYRKIEDFGGVPGEIGGGKMSKIIPKFSAPPVGPSSVLRLDRRMNQ